MPTRELNKKTGLPIDANSLSAINDVTEECRELYYAKPEGSFQNKGVDRGHKIGVKVVEGLLKAGGVTLKHNMPPWVKPNWCEGPNPPVGPLKDAENFVVMTHKENMAYTTGEKLLNELLMTTDKEIKTTLTDEIKTKMARLDEKQTHCLNCVCHLGFRTARGHMSPTGKEMRTTAADTWNKDRVDQIVDPICFADKDWWSFSPKYEAGCKPCGLSKVVTL